MASDAAARKARYAARVLVDGRLVAPLPPKQHGRRWTYTHHGCRCTICTTSASADHRRRRVPEAVTSEMHGTAYGYQTGCRCAECRAAQTAESHRKRAARYAERVLFHPGPDVPHGTTTGYGYYGCRCYPCQAANTDDCAAREERRRAKTKKEPPNDPA